MKTASSEPFFTVAIVTGWEPWPVRAISGAYLGIAAIPFAWRNKLENVTKVEDLAVDLRERHKSTLA
jgi:ADP-ribosylglycohydrolase